MPAIVTPAVDPGGFAALVSTRVPPGCVRLTCDDPPFDETLLMGEEPPAYTGGFGGWEITPRPRQIGMTTWQGTEPLTLTLSLMLDGLRARQTQEPVLRKLYAVARGDDDSPPGVLRIAGIPLIADRWVIDELELGDAILHPNGGARIRQALTLTLREYVPPTYLRRYLQPSSKRKSKAKTITVKRGDTPTTIARRARCTWTDLRELNPGVVTKANQKLKPGSKLRVPIKRTVERRAKGSPRSRKSSSSRRSN
jgi:LysM domain